MPSNSDSPSYIYPKSFRLKLVKTVFLLKPPMFYFLEHQKTASHQIWPQIRISRPSFTLKPVKTSFLSNGNDENREVLFLEHQKTALHQIWHQIRIPRPSFTLKSIKNGFYNARCTQNRRCSIFRTSGGATQNLALDSNSPPSIYLTPRFYSA